MIRAVIICLCLGAAISAKGVQNPPYDVYGYLADSDDNPPLNYTKVCEPGREGESKATYVEIGVYFPIFRTGVAQEFSGDLEIPAYIDGLPVRKIHQGAFSCCSNLKSISIPSTVREIGDLAFADCLSLTNVVFASGVSRVGDSVFSNCVSLTKVRFPKTLSWLGRGSFQGCVSLTDVYFDGNAPRLPGNEASAKSVLGEGIYKRVGYCERFKVHINRDSYGWISPYEKGVPEKWPVDYGYDQAHETVVEIGETKPSEETGFVTIITEIKGGAVAIPEMWTQQFPRYVTLYGNEFTVSLTKPTGKKDADGNSMLVWQDYVAGTDPTDVNDQFKANIEVIEGEPVITVYPKLSDAEVAKRKYTIFGRESLRTGAWTEVKTGDERLYNFFKVTVEMR